MARRRKAHIVSKPEYCQHVNKHGIPVFNGPAVKRKATPAIINQINEIAEKSSLLVAAEKPKTAAAKIPFYHFGYEGRSTQYCPN